MALRQWITLLFAAAAVVTAVPVGLYTQPAIVVGGFLTGFCAQGMKISVDTLVQTGVDDVYRGRVFSLYDMIFNVGQVSAAALGAADPARQREVLPGAGADRGRLSRMHRACVVRHVPRKAVIGWMAEAFQAG